MTGRDRRGFTIVELMVVAVLGALVVAATYEILLTNQRAFTVQTAQIQGQQTVRAGMSVLFGELREVSRSGGDLLSMSPTKVTVRVMRGFGLVCGTSVTGSPIRVKKVGRFFEVGDSIFVFADNNPRRSRDDTILAATVTAVDTTQNCTGTDTAQMLTVPALGTALANDTVRLGAPVRSYAVYTYGLYQVDGDYYLARESTAAGVERLVGPLSENGIRLTYLDSLSNETTVATSVSQIEITIHSLSKVVDNRGKLVADSLTTRITLRN